MSALCFGLAQQGDLRGWEMLKRIVIIAIVSYAMSMIATLAQGAAMLLGVMAPGVPPLWSVAWTAVSGVCILVVGAIIVAPRVWRELKA